MPPNIINLAIPAFLVLLIAEAIADAVMRRQLYEVRDTAASLSMGIGNVIINLGAKALTFALFTWIARFAIWHVPFTWWGWTIAFFAEEFSYYWFHRASHECRFFWASHVVHHSSQRYNLGTALRQTWTSSLTGAFVFWMWMPLAGFAPAMIFTLQATSLLYQFWIHTELIRSIGPLERVLNTPSHHRVHHGSNPQYIDRNHGGTLIIWDRLFGTYEPEREPVAYGLTKNIQTYNPLRIAFHEWIDIARDLKSARTWRARFLYVFGRPGWREELASEAAGAD
jgi:sterol desaturase/sphingolipid hydroxylase (fatty acid hydroxylase superfamily)